MSVLIVRLIIVLLLVGAPGVVCAAQFAAGNVKMRPYAGIGLLMLPHTAAAHEEWSDLPVLYEEPSLYRIGKLETGRLPGHEWIFGSESVTARLFVTSTRGGWLRVVYDEAGREGWLRRPFKARFVTWDTYLRGRYVSLLSGLQKKYYQAADQPGGVLSTTLKSGQVFKVIGIKNDWALVMSDRAALSWLRWRDEDGRLLISLGKFVADNS